MLVLDDTHINHKLLDDQFSQISGDAFQGCVQLKMLSDSERRIQAIKLRTVANMFPCITESTWCKHVVIDNLHLAFCWLDFSCYHLEHGRLASARDSKKGEALSVLESEGNSLDGVDFFTLAHSRISFLCPINPDRKLLCGLVLHFGLRLDDILINTLGICTICLRDPDPRAVLPNVEIDHDDDNPPGRNTYAKHRKLWPGNDRIETIRLRIITFFTIVFITWFKESTKLFEGDMKHSVHYCELGAQEREDPLEGFGIHSRALN